MIGAAIQLPTTTNRIRWKTPTPMAATANALHGTVSYHSHRRSDVKGVSSEVADTRFKVFQLLKSELLNDPIFQWTHYSRQWLHQMIDYNVPQGKLLRSNALIECYTSLKEGEDISEDELFDASVLGWCIEWLQASLLILDDIIDNSETRRGQACWYRVPKVGSIAINDGVVLQYQVPRILTKHFQKKPYYKDLLNLFNEVGYQTVLGQMMDVITTVEGERDLLNYSWTLNRLITLNKTSYYSFYLPVACALLLAGENLHEHENVKDMLFDMGNYFQMLDDYLDCFGDPNKSGKIGSDIEDCKCSWLVLQCMELCNDEQKKVVLEHYGKADPKDVAKVKGIYNEVGVQQVCCASLTDNYHQLQPRVEAHPSKPVHAIWATYIDALHKLIHSIIN